MGWVNKNNNWYANISIWLYFQIQRGSVNVLLVFFFFVFVFCPREMNLFKPKKAWGVRLRGREASCIDCTCYKLYWLHAGVPPVFNCSDIWDQRQSVLFQISDKCLCLLLAGMAMVKSRVQIYIKRINLQRRWVRICLSL